MFQFTPPWEGATQLISSWLRPASFQFTPPWEGATLCVFQGIGLHRVSIHAPVGGGDVRITITEGVTVTFQFTPPWEGATSNGSTRASCAAGFNSRPRGRGRRGFHVVLPLIDFVSIHAPVGGGDTPPSPFWGTTCRFNSRPRGRGRPPALSARMPDERVSIHAPVGGGDATHRAGFHVRLVSIHAPVGGGDTRRSRSSSWSTRFNSRPRGRGRRRAIRERGTATCRFNSRPRGRGRRRRAAAAEGRGVFQFTPPWEGATCALRRDGRPRRVSIHAPVGGGDAQLRRNRPGQSRVSIHAPVGGGDAAHRRDSWLSARVSIHAPVGGGDPVVKKYQSHGVVSIHAPVGGGDRGLAASSGAGGTCFNSRPRGRGRRRIVCNAYGIKPVSIHAPVGGGDVLTAYRRKLLVKFQFTPPWEGATPRSSYSASSLLLFQFTPPWEGATASPFPELFRSFCFNSRPRGRGRQQHLPFLTLFGRFQFTPPWEGATVRGNLAKLVSLFQFTPPWEGATQRSLLGQREPTGFNSRPRGRGRHPRVIEAVKFVVVSIHAPVGGGDRRLLISVSFACVVSIHAPVGGGDLEWLPSKSRIPTFQFTPPWEGATSSTPSRLAKSQAFQFTPPWEGATPALVISG